MDDSLDLWESIVNNPFFSNRSSQAMIIFFNKSDLFKLKIQHTSLRVWNQNFNGLDNNEKDAVDFIRMEYMTRNNQVNTQIYTHITVNLN